MIQNQEIRWLLQEKYGGRESEESKRDIVRLKKGEHIDYVIGWVDFLGCRIDLSERPFIPRPETEYWVEKAIQEMLNKAVVDNRPSLAPAARGVCTLGGLPSLRSEPGQTTSESLSLTALSRYQLRALDIFAGSGCIGIAVLKHVPHARVDFAEKEPRFLRQIERNAELNGIEKSRYRVLRSDVFSGVRRKACPEPVEGYDYILANPPYVAETRREKVQQSVLEQEPHGAMFGGGDGLFYTRQLLREAKNYLVPGGVLYLEFDSPQKSQIAQGECLKDQYNKWRYARIVF